MGAARRTIVWLAPGQVSLVREVARAAELSIVGVGCPERGRAGPIAEELGAQPLAGGERDDLRAAVAAADADIFWIADPGPEAPGGDDAADAAAIRGASSRGVRILTLEPLPATAGAMADQSWTGSPSAIDVPCFVPSLFESTPLRQSEELLAALGAARLVAVELWSGPADGSLAAKLYAAMDAVRRLIGEPESIDAAYAGPGRGPSVHSAPGESLRGLRGDIAASLRFADGRAGTVSLSDQSAGWERSLTLVGPGGRMRVTDDAVHWVDAAGDPHDESPGGRRRKPGGAAAAISRAMNAALAGGPGGAQTLAMCHAALLSCRTGQGESPATIRRIAGLE